MEVWESSARGLPQTSAFASSTRRRQHEHSCTSQNHGLCDRGPRRDRSSRATWPSRRTGPSSSRAARRWFSPRRRGGRRPGRAQISSRSRSTSRSDVRRRQDSRRLLQTRGAPTERAILTARMIDRPIRPLWPKGFTNEVQVICTTLSADLVTLHDILAINGASAALMISPLPFLGPVGGVRIGLVDGELRRQPDTDRDGGGRRARPDRRRDEGTA